MQKLLRPKQGLEKLKRMVTQAILPEMRCQQLLQNPSFDL